MEESITVIVTEDHPLYRDIIRHLLKDHHMVVMAEAENGLQLQAHLEEGLRPDVILLDLNMPEMNGNVTMDWLSHNHPEQRVIVLSQFDDQELREDYIRRGARGYLSKEAISQTPKELIHAITKVHGGGKYSYRKEDHVAYGFSPVQKGLMNLIPEGKQNQEIAQELGLSVSAIEKQKKKIARMLGIDTRELGKFIVAAGLNFLRAPNNRGKGGGGKAM